MKMFLRLFLSLFVISHVKLTFASSQSRAKEIAVSVAIKKQTLNEWLETQLAINCASNREDLEAVKYINEHLGEFGNYIKEGADFGRVLPGDKKGVPLALRAFDCELTNNKYEEGIFSRYLALELVSPSIRSKEGKGFFAIASSHLAASFTSSLKTINQLIKVYPDIGDFTTKADVLALESLMKLVPQKNLYGSIDDMTSLVFHLYSNPKGAMNRPALKKWRLNQYLAFDKKNQHEADWTIFCYSLPKYLQVKGCALEQLESWFADGQLDPNQSLELTVVDHNIYKGSAIHAFALSLDYDYWTDRWGKSFRPDSKEIIRLASHFDQLLKYTKKNVLLAGKFNLIKLLLSRSNAYFPERTAPYDLNPIIQVIQKFSDLGVPLNSTGVYNSKPYYAQPFHSSFYYAVNYPSVYLEWIAEREKLAKGILSTLTKDDTFDNGIWNNSPGQEGNSIFSLSGNYKYDKKWLKVVRLWSQILIERFPNRREEIEVVVVSSLSDSVKTIDDLNALYIEFGGVKLNDSAKARLLFRAFSLKASPQDPFIQKLWELDGLKKYGFQVLSNFTLKSVPTSFTHSFIEQLLSLGADPMVALVPGEPKSRYFDFFFQNPTTTEYNEFMAAISKTGHLHNLSQQELDSFIMNFRNSTYDLGLSKIQFIKDMEAASGKQLDMSGLDSNGDFKLFSYIKNICEEDEKSKFLTQRMGDANTLDRRGNNIALALHAYCKMNKYFVLKKIDLEIFQNAGVDLTTKNIDKADLMFALLISRPQDSYYFSDYVGAIYYLASIKAFDPAAKASYLSTTSFSFVVYRSGYPVSLFNTFYLRAVELGYDINNWDGIETPLLSLDAWFFSPDKERKKLTTLLKEWPALKMARVDGEWMSLLTNAKFNLPLEIFDLNFDAARIFPENGRNILFSLIGWAISHPYTMDKDDFKAVSEKMIIRGADPRLIDQDGETPLDFARRFADKLPEDILREVYYWTNPRPVKL